MDDNAMPKRMLKGKLYTKRRKGRPRMRWLDEVENDLKRMKVKGWKGKMRNREQWRLVVKEGQGPPRTVAPNEEEEGLAGETYCLHHQGNKNWQAKNASSN
jgi:hypothetical protein